MGFLGNLVGNKYRAKGPSGPEFDQSKAGGIIAGNVASSTGQQQNDLAKLLIQQGQGYGQVPSLAQQQLQQALQNNAAQSAGAIASQRGLNPALAARMILQNLAGLNQQTAGQAAQLRSQEQLSAQDKQLQAQGLASQLLGSERGGDIGQMGGYTGYLGTLGGLQNQTQSTNAGIEQSNANLGTSLVGGALGGIGSAGVGHFLPPGIPGKSQGGAVEGRAKTAGDSPSNDTVPAMLSPGEIVLPRSVTEHPEAGNKAKEFVEALQKRRGGEGYAKVVRRHKELEDHLGQIKKLFMGGLTDDGNGEPALAGNAYLNAGESSLVPSPPKSFEPPPENQLSFSPEQVTGTIPVKPVKENPAAVKPSAPVPHQSSEPNYDAMAREGEKTFEKGLAAQALAAESEGKEKANIVGNELAQRKAVEEDYNKQIAAADANVTKMRQEVADFKFDPNRYYHSMSTGQKLGSAISLIIGGIGAGLAHGPNMALEVMDRAIQRDVDAQEKDLGKKQSILADYIKQGYTLREAKKLAYLDLRDATAIQLEQVTNKHLGPERGAENLQKAGMAQAQSAKERSEIASAAVDRKYKQAQMAGAGAQTAVPVDLGEGKTGYVSDPKDLAKIKVLQEHSDELRTALEGIEKFRKAHSGGALSPSAKNEAEVLMGRAKTALGGMASMSENESMRGATAEIIEKMVKDPSAKLQTDESINAMVKAIRAYGKDKERAAYRSVLVNGRQLFPTASVTEFGAGSKPEK